MNGPHDLGGRMGFGKLPIEKDEPIFHSDWEKRVLGLTLCAGALGYWTLDESRFARESIPPEHYYGSSYYEIWMRGLITLLTRHGELTPQEIKSARMITAGKATAKKLAPDAVATVLKKGAPTKRDITPPARFSLGDQVHTINRNPDTHTRMPSYARDKIGVVTALHGAHVLPDTNAHGLGEQPTHLYSIAFDGRTLWGPDTDPKLSVSIDAWEVYLEHA